MIEIKDPVVNSFLFPIITNSFTYHFLIPLFMGILRGKSCLRRLRNIQIIQI